MRPSTRAFSSDERVRRRTVIDDRRPLFNVRPRTIQNGSTRRTRVGWTAERRSRRPFRGESLVNTRVSRFAQLFAGTVSTFAKSRPPERENVRPVFTVTPRDRAFRRFCSRSTVRSVVNSCARRISEARVRAKTRRPLWFWYLTTSPYLKPHDAYPVMTDNANEISSGVCWTWKSIEIR